LYLASIIDIDAPAPGQGGGGSANAAPSNGGNGRTDCAGMDGIASPCRNAREWWSLVVSKQECSLHN
jgi:hypothetical protein